MPNSEWIFYEKFRFTNYNSLRSILSKQKPDVLHRKSCKPLTNTPLTHGYKDKQLQRPKLHSESHIPKSFSIRTLAGYSLRNPTTKAPPSIPYKSLNQR